MLSNAQLIAQALLHIHNSRLELDHLWRVVREFSVSNEKALAFVKAVRVEAAAAG
jgi:hypothetical protein